jgi:hypothetical protein
MNYWNKDVELKALVGNKVAEVKGLEKESYEVRLVMENGNEYMFYHSQDCCECVVLNDFELSCESLVGATILSAEEVSGDEKEPECAESYTWTFYKIETDKGGLWMRWLGESNGYYSESIDLVWVNKPEAE